MDFRIESLGEFKMVGYRMQTTNAFMKGMKDCPGFWKKILKEGKNQNLIPLINKEPFGLIGACVYNVDESDAKKFDYYIAASTNMEAPEDMEEYVVSAQTWAVFPCTMKTIGRTQRAIVNKWAKDAEYDMLNTGYMSGNMKSAAPDLEVYGQGDDVEIWVPVRKKD